MTAEVESDMRVIPLSMIRPSARNRKIDGESQGIISLSESIASEGLIQPIVVRPIEPDEEGHEFEIVAGERRWAAWGRLAGVGDIPCIIRDMDEGKAHTARIIENLQREDVPPLEQAEGVDHLLKLCGGNAAEVAARLGYKEGWVRTRANLRYLSTAWRNEIARHDTNYEDVAANITYQEEIAKLPEATQDRLLDESALRWCRNLKDLRSKIRAKLRVIAERPWSEKWESELTRDEQCDRCRRRTDKCDSLFAEIAGDDEQAMCLDPGCWEEKRVAWLLDCVREAQKKHPDLVLLPCPTDYYSRHDDDEKWKPFLELAEVLGYHQFRTEEDRDGEADDYFDERLGVWISGEKQGQTELVWCNLLEEDPEEDQDQVEEDPVEVERRKHIAMLGMARRRQASTWRDMLSDQIYDKALNRPCKAPTKDVLLSLLLMFPPKFGGYDLKGDSTEETAEWIKGEVRGEVWTRAAPEISDSIRVTYELTRYDIATLCAMLKIGTEWLSEPANAIALIPSTDCAGKPAAGTYDAEKDEFTVAWVDPSLSEAFGMDPVGDVLPAKAFQLLYVDSEEQSA